MGFLLISCLLRDTWSAYSNFVARNAFIKIINLRLTSTLTFSIDSKEFSRNRIFSGPWRRIGRKLLWLSNERVEDGTMIKNGTSCDQCNLYIKHQTPCWHWVPRCRRHVVRHQMFKEKENKRKSRYLWETTPLLWGGWGAWGIPIDKSLGNHKPFEYFRCCRGGLDWIWRRILVSLIGRGDQRRIN